jgi:hypothetical protein
MIYLVIQKRILSGHKDYNVPTTYTIRPNTYIIWPPFLRTTNPKSYQIRILSGQIRTLPSHAESEIPNHAQFYGVRVRVNYAQFVT